TAKIRATWIALAIVSDPLRKCEIAPMREDGARRSGHSAFSLVAADLFPEVMGEGNALKSDYPTCVRATSAVVSISLLCAACSDWDTLLECTDAPCPDTSCQNNLLQSPSFEGGLAGWHGTYANVEAAKGAGRNGGDAARVCYAPDPMSLND